MPPNPSRERDLLQPLDDGQGPALPLSAAELEAAVHGVVERALSPQRAPLRRRLIRRPRIALLWAAAALAISGIAAALISAKPWLWTPEPSAGSAATAPAPTASPLSARPAPMESRELPRDASRDAPTLAAEAPPLGHPVPAEAARTTARAPGAEPQAISPRPSAADSLQAANQLRRQGRWADAARAYSQIASSFPGTAQGSVAALAAASLHLEHLNDAQGALALYQSSLRTSGLSAEAELGIANCYRALADREREIAALRRLITAYPGSLFHERAARRLQALQATRP